MPEITLLNVVIRLIELAVPALAICAAIVGLGVGAVAVAIRFRLV